MLLFHLGSSALLFSVGSKISGKQYVGAGAVLLFSLSPLDVYFQRRILLDNIMTFWILLAIYLVICRYRGGLGPIIASGCSFSIALLSKEIGIVFLPALVYMLWTILDKRHRALGIGSWLSIVVSIGSTWLVYAVLKGEVFPTGTILGGTNEHVSLIETLKYQISRGNGHGLFSLDNDFWATMRAYWLPRDPFIVIGGMAAVATSMLLGFRTRGLWLAALPGLCILVFLARGSLVIEYYIVPAIPFFALNIVLNTSAILTIVQRVAAKQIPLARRSQTTLVGTILIVAIALMWIRQLSTSDVARNNYLVDQTAQQREVLVWVEANVPHTAFIVTDHYGLLDLTLAGFSKAHSHWKIDRDPDITTKMLQDDWRNIDYLIVTPQVTNDTDAAALRMVSAAYDNSTLSQSFPNSGGWPIALRKVDALAIAKLDVPVIQSTADTSITVTITADVTAIKYDVTGANFTVEIRNPSGDIIQKAVLGDQNFLQRVSQSFAFTLTLPPGSDPTAMTVVLGAFDATWTNAYMWRVYTNLLPSVAGISTSTVPAPTTTPAPSTALPNPSPMPLSVPTPLPNAVSPPLAMPPVVGTISDQQVREQEALLYSGEFEATIDYGNGTHATVQGQFDFGDDQRPQQLHLTTTYIGKTGTRSTERIVIGDQGWKRDQDGAWSPLATIGGVKEEITPFLPQLNHSQTVTTVNNPTSTDLSWYDISQGVFKSLSVDPRSGIPQHLRSVATDNEVITTVTYLGWNSPVAIDLPQNK